MERKFFAPTIGFWYRAAREHQKKREMAEALMAMEQCFNHTESIVAYLLEKSPEAKRIFDETTARHKAEAEKS